MAAAAQGALPGEALYPIKRGIEQAQAGLSMTSAGRGRDLLDQADDRLGEVQGLLASTTSAAPPRCRPRSTRSPARRAGRRPAAGLLPADPRPGHDRRAARVHRRPRRPRAARRTAPPEASATSRGRDDAARHRRPGHPAVPHLRRDLPPLDIPRLFLASAEANRALRGHPAGRPGQQPPRGPRAGRGSPHDAGTGAGHGPGTAGRAVSGRRDSAPASPGPPAPAPGSRPPGVDLGVPDVNERRPRTSPPARGTQDPRRRSPTRLGDGLRRPRPRRCSPTCRCRSGARRLGPRVSRRRTGAASAACRASAGWSRGPGRSR